MNTNTLIDHLSKAARNRPDKVFALLENGNSKTYRELFSGGKRVAATLTSLGAKPGDRVGLLAEKSFDVIEAYLGAVMAGCVFLPMNPAYSEREISFFLQDADPSILITSTGLLQRNSLLNNVARDRMLVTLDGKGRNSLSDAARAAPPDFIPVPRSAKDLAAILYTSGTTGRPKGAMLSHGALAANCSDLVEAWRFSESDRLIHSLPLFHTHGLFLAVNIPLSVGASIIFHSRFEAGNIIEAMCDATVFMGVPTFYTRLLDCADLTEKSAANMRLFVSGSAPLPSATHEAWRERTGHSILERYGMTETNITVSNPYSGERRPGTVGKAVKGTRIRITDPATGKALPQGKVGSLEVKGPGLFSGYWNLPDKTAEDMRDDGFFVTGDLGSLDEEGYLTISGRSKELIISGGLNVYPKEVEDVINSVPGVRESAVIGVPHADFGEAVLAVVILENETTLSDETISEGLKARLASYKRPKMIIFVREFPRNAMGKIQKNVLQERFRGALTG